MKKPTRRDLGGLSLEPLHIARNSTKADVYKLEWPPQSGNFAVLKDMKNRPAWFRLTAGRWFLCREFLALRALDGVAGVPRAISRPDRDCLLMEWRAGTPVMDWAMGTVPDDALAQIASILEQVHSCGVIHGDLHRSNILLTPQGQVTIIDWATAGVFRSRRSAAKQLTFAEWVTLDIRALAKLKARHAPESMSEREKDALLSGSKIYRFVRSAGFKIRRLFGHRRAKSPDHAAARYKSFVENAQKRLDSEADS